MTTISNAVLPHNQTAATNFLRRHRVTLMTLAALGALLSGVVTLKTLDRPVSYALTHEIFDPSPPA